MLNEAGYTSKAPAEVFARFWLSCARTSSPCSGGTQARYCEIVEMLVSTPGTAARLSTAMYARVPQSMEESAGSTPTTVARSDSLEPDCPYRVMVSVPSSGRPRASYSGAFTTSAGARRCWSESVSHRP